MSKSRAAVQENSDNLALAAERAQELPDRAHEVIGLITGLLAALIFLSLISYDGIDATGKPAGANWIGLAGDWMAYVLYAMFGVVSYLIDGFLWYSAVCLFAPRVGSIARGTVLGFTLLPVFAAVALHAMMPQSVILGGHTIGGGLGQILGEISISLVSTTGTLLIVFTGMALILLLITDISFAVAFGAVARSGQWSGRQAFATAVRILRAWQDENSRFEEETPRPTRKPRLKVAQAPTEPAQPPTLPQEPVIVELLSTVPETREISSQAPRIVVKKPLPKSAKRDAPELSIVPTPVRGHFHLPPLSLLNDPPAEAPGTELDEAYLKQTADTLVRILSDFNVIGEVREIHPGPVVTMFEFQPRSGTKLSKIESLSSELAMQLEVFRVRVVAPIPGKNAVGFELPNANRETVYLKEMLADDGFQKNRKARLPMTLGKDIGGAPQFVDLAKMPHLLIAGTTGSGKSVSLNAMLVSLLYRYTPEDLRLLLIDPKMVELGIYDGIPHLLLPVVSDMSKACLALKWAVDEMERRYQLFADLSVRNLEGYNAKIERIKTEHAALPEDERRRRVLESGAAQSINEDGEVVVVASAADLPEKLAFLPLIVIVIDELADLMMVAAKDVETSIARLAQKARAAGLHLIVATQRPSVDVVTGLIKANFPSRISFRVSSYHDSRTILGCNGAENLLGAGDMLVLPPGTSDLCRVHGAYVDDDEINRISTFLKAQGAPQYDEEILKPRDGEENNGIDETEKDEVYDQAVAIVAEEQFCSISMLQRRLRIGYNRAARIVEIMEKDGVVGPANHQNKREVLITPH